MCDWQMYLAAVIYQLFSPSFLPMLYSLTMFFCFFRNSISYEKMPAARLEGFHAEIVLLEGFHTEIVFLLFESIPLQSTILGKCDFSQII